MDINIILQAISTVGFPIVCCAALFWMINKQDENHKAEVNALRSVLEENTKAIIQLRDLLTYIKGDKAS